MDSYRKDDDPEWTTVKVEGVSVMNMYKPTNTSSGKLHTLPEGSNYVCW